MGGGKEGRRRGSGGKRCLSGLRGERRTSPWPFADDHLHLENSPYTPAWLEAFGVSAVPIVISSDTYRPEEVGRDRGAVALVRRCGYGRVCRFVRREREEIGL